MRKVIVTAIAALALSGGAATPALAASEKTVAVSYADLDLTTAAGAAALERRIDAAVATVCAKPSVRDLYGMNAWQECKAEAYAGVRDQLSLLEPYASLALAEAF